MISKGKNVPITLNQCQAPDDVEKVVPAIEAAYARSLPVVMLIGREPL